MRTESRRVGFKIEDTGFSSRMCGHSALTFGMTIPQMTESSFEKKFKFFFSQRRTQPPHTCHSRPLHHACIGPLVISIGRMLTMARLQ